MTHSVYSPVFRPRSPVILVVCRPRSAVFTAVYRLSSEVGINGGME